MGESPILAGQRITAGVLNGLPVTLSTLVTGSVDNSATETIIGTWTIPANDAVAGSGYQFRVIGTADITSVTNTVRLRLRLGSVAGALLMQGSALTVPAGAFTNRWWNMHGYIYTPAAGSSGSLDGSSWWAEALQSSTPDEAISGCTAQSVDTTAAILLCVTADWGNAVSGDIVRTLDGGLNRI